MSTSNYPTARLRTAGSTAVLGAALLALAGCATEPPRSEAYGYAGPPPNTTVYAYPERGQSADQQSRDRYDCSLWAVKQSGFDPSAASVPQAYRVQVSGPPPGTGTAIGAIAGAVLGAALAGDDDAGAGAAFGAITGAMIGSSSDAARAQQNEAMASEQAQQQQADLEQGAANYRRALSACLDARGYSVK